MAESNTNANRSIKVEDVDTRWPYRAGYPRLLHQPVQSRLILGTDPMPIARDIFEQLRSQINVILEDQGIPRGTKDTWMAYRTYAYPSARTSGRLRIIADCTYDKETSHSKMWANAVVKIHEAMYSLIGREIDIGIELYDFSYMLTCQICEPPSHCRDFRANWVDGQGYRDKIHAVFDHYPRMFQAMIPTGLRAMGHRVQHHMTVIFFDALNAEDDAWDVIEERIRSILPEDIGIEVRQAGGPLLCCSDLTTSWSSDDFARPPRPGCDISAQTQKGEGGFAEGGTMGGYVMTKAKDSQIITTYGVTNAHVVLGAHEAVTIKKQTCRDTEVIKVQSPSEKSLQEYESNLREELQVLRPRVSQQKEIIEAVKETNPELAQKQENFVRVIESKIAERVNLLRMAESNPYIGSLQCATLGHRDYHLAAPQNRLIMDLALINVNELASMVHPKDIFLKENTAKPVIRKNVTCETWDVDGLGSTGAEKRIQVVAKLGQSSGWTIGIVSEFEAEIDLPMYRNGLEVTQKLSAWAVTKPYYNPFSSGQSWNSFSMPGDSGSFVIAAHGWKVRDKDNKIPMTGVVDVGPLLDFKPVIVGLLCATSTSGPMSYFIPFDAVKKEIESLTGEEMVWPRKRTADDIDLQT